MERDIVFEEVYCLVFQKEIKTVHLVINQDCGFFTKILPESKPTLTEV